LLNPIENRPLAIHVTQNNNNIFRYKFKIIIIIKSMASRFHG